MTPEKWTRQAVAGMHDEPVAAGAQYRKVQLNDKVSHLDLWRVCFIGDWRYPYFEFAPPNTWCPPGTTHIVAISETREGIKAAMQEVAA